MKNALLFISLLFVLGACGQKQEKSEAIRFLIGTTDKSDSSGVSVARLDPESGEISFEGFTPTAPGPGYLTFSDRKSTRLNSSHVKISYAVFCLKKKKKQMNNIKNARLT